MTFDVQFSLEAAAELLRITEVIGSTVVVLKAAESIRHQLEDDPAGRGEFLSEGLLTFEFSDRERLKSRGCGQVTFHQATRDPQLACISLVCLTCRLTCGG